MLLNSVLNRTPVYYLSFMRMLGSVSKRVVAIQRNFLWGGTLERQKISWVKWSDVCNPKVKGAWE